MAGAAAAVPDPGKGVGERLAVRLTPDALRQVRGGHPWVFDNSIVSTSRVGAPGDLAVVFDHQRRFVAIGLYDPTSPIRIRVLHRGAPTPIDGAWWRAQIGASLARRAGLEDGDTTAYRVVHGENDALPGLVVDRYSGTCVIKVYTASLVPHLGAISDAVTDVVGPERIVVRASRHVARLVEEDRDAGVVWFREHGLQMSADVGRGQKTGHFLDQRDNRRLVAAHAEGARLLDVFACTGGFSLHAAAGGASSVHLVDQSAGAIETAATNLRANHDRRKVRECDVTSEVGDAFEVLAELRKRGQRFDVVVVDPPSFASKQADVERAIGAYRRLTSLAVELVVPGGLLFQASCSSRVPADRFVGSVVDETARRGRRADVLARTGHPIDHPIGFPEGAYLKAVLLRLP